MDRSEYVTRAIQCLQKHGHRITASRCRVIEALAVAERPLSPYSLLDQLRTGGEPFVLMTLYRTLELLELYGLAHHLAFSGGYLPCSLEEFSGCHHYVTCQVCREVREVPCPGLAGVERRAAANTGFRVERHLLEFVGLCPECCMEPKGSEPAISGVIFPSPTN